MITLNFVRHGQSESNLSHLISGQTQTPLTQVGIDELKQLKETVEYPEFDYLFSSDLIRAIDTAEILFDKTPIQLKEFRETNFGPFESLPIDESIDEFYEHFLGNVIKGDMDGYDSLKERVLEGIRLVMTTLNENKKNRATIVAHNGVLRMVHHIFKPTEFQEYRNFYVKNGHGFSLDFDAYDKLLEVRYF